MEGSDEDVFDGGRHVIGGIVWFVLIWFSLIFKISDWLGLVVGGDVSETFPPCTTEVTTTVGCFRFSCSANRSFDRKPFLVHKWHEYVFPTFLFRHVTWKKTKQYLNEKKLFGNCIMNRIPNFLFYLSTNSNLCVKCKYKSGCWLSRKVFVGFNTSNYAMKFFLEVYTPLV